MACCAAIAVVICLVRGLWFRLVPGARPAEASFAPPVRRPLGAAPQHPALAAPRRKGHRRQLAPAVLTGVAIGILGYSGLIAALLLTGLATKQASAPWIPRDVALVLIAGTAAALGGPGRRTELAPVLLGIGMAWSELGLVDMHLLRLFTFPHLGVVSDLLFHGAGLLVVLLALPRILTPKAATA